MKHKKSYSSQNFSRRSHLDERCGELGSASVIVLLILVLVSAFVILAMSRTVNETMIMNNDQSGTKAFYAAEASLETMTRSFNKVFDTKFEPTPQDITRIETNKPRSFDDFNFDQKVTAPATTAEASVLPGGPFEGMRALRDTWNLSATATYTNGAQVQLTRDFINNRIPIFQFVAFYDDDFECHPGP